MLVGYVCGEVNVVVVFWCSVILVVGGQFVVIYQYVVLLVIVGDILVEVYFKFCIGEVYCYVGFGKGGIGFYFFLVDYYI